MILVSKRLKPILHIAWSHLISTFGDFHGVFTKSVPGWSTSQALSCKAAWRSGQSWPQGISNWLVSLWHGQIISYCFRTDSPDVRKVEKEMASMTEKENKFLLNLCQHQQILLDPSDPSYQNGNKRRGCTSASCWSVWSAWPDGLTLFIVRTKVTGDNFTKWSFTKSAKLS